MCTLDDIEPNEILLPTAEVKEDYLDCTGDYCMSIDIHNVNIEDDTDINRRIEFVCRNELFHVICAQKKNAFFSNPNLGKSHCIIIFWQMRYVNVLKLKEIVIVSQL